MVETENARCGHSFEDMLKDYIDCKKDNDATSEFLTDMPNVNRMSEGNSSEPTEVEHVVTTLTVDDVFEIECSSVAEEIVIEDVKVFDTSSPTSEVVEVIGNGSVEELQSPIVDDVNEIITDEHFNSKHVSINNEFDTFFDKIPSKNDLVLVNDLMEIDTPHVNETTSQCTEDVEIIPKDSTEKSISQSNSTENTIKPSTNDNKVAEISQSNSTENKIEPSINDNKMAEMSQSNSTENTIKPSTDNRKMKEISQSNSTENTIESNTNDNKTVSVEVTDKPYKCHICGKFFSRASSLKCHIRLHVEGPDSLLRGSSEPVENSVKSQFAELSTKKEEVVEPVADENITDTVPDDETGSNVLNNSRDSCDLTEDEDKREYKCIVCEKTFSRRSSLTCHYKFHPKSPISKNQEDIPVEIINDENPMEVDPLDEPASKEEQFKCNKCPRTFSQKNTYVWHMKMHETNVRKKSADNTASTSNLTNGVEDTEMVDITNDVILIENNAEKTDASGVNLYKCHLCPRSFPQLRGLKTHSGVHRRKPVNEQSNGPEVLNQMFYEEVSSRKNACCTKNHNHDDEMTKLYKCNVCCKCFCDINNLKAHLARNHEEEDISEGSDNDIIVESQTKASAVNNESRIFHKQATPGIDEYFHDQKPPIIIPGLYKCGVCSKTFDEIQLLGDHVNIHIQAHNESLLNITDESATEELCCVVCEKTFRSQNALNRHMNEHRRREEEIFVRVTSSGRKIRERRPSEDLSTTSPIKCIPCNRTFESVRAKHIHDSSKHPVEHPENEEQELANENEADTDNQQNEFVCDCCNRQWPDIKTLNRHKGWTKRRLSSSVGRNLVVDEVDPLEPDPIIVEENKTENDVSSSVKCGCCNELFQNIPALNAHLSGQTNGAVTEPTSPSPNRENKDMVNCDSLRDLVKCDRCDKFCSSIPALKLHIISDHTKKSLLQSSTEGQNSTTNKTVENPLTAPANQLPVQIDNSTVSVDDSPNDIPSQSNDEVVDQLVIIKSKSKRSRISANQQSISCEELPQHKPLQCDLCEETFASKQALSNHKSTHVIDSTVNDIDKPKEQVDTPEVGTFICCDKIFATSRALKIHQNRHTPITMVDISPILQQKSPKPKNSKTEAAKFTNTRFTEDVSGANHSATDTESEEDLFREYKCSICDKKVSSRKTLRYHREKHFKPGEIDPEFNGEFSCNKCHKRFDKKTSLRVHKAYHTTLEKNSNAPIDYGCYSDLRNGIFKCNECVKEFDTVKGVLMHCTKTHKEPETELDSESEPEHKEYSCPVCDRTFNCCQGLAGHMSRHRPALECTCEICKRVFANKSNLKRHRRLIHDISSDIEEEEEQEEEEQEGEESEKEYVCTQCDRVFNNYRGLNGHMQMHQLYCCTDCNIEFSTFRNYNIHIESNHTIGDLKSTKSESMKEFECNKCDKSFASAKSLRGHKAVHSNTVRGEPEPEPEPVPEFKCTLCDRSFFTAKSLGGHKSMHSRNGDETEPDDSDDEPESAGEDADNEEDPSNEFACPRCDRFFPRARSLANHMNTHIAQDNPLELHCPQPQCERVFISHRALSAHFLAHRPEDSLQVFSCPKCKEPFRVMKAMYDHFVSKHKRTKKVERVSRRSSAEITSNATEKRTTSSRSRSQAAPAVVVEDRKTRSKSVGDKVSSRNEKLISSARSNESVNKDNAEDTTVRKSLRLKSSTTTTPSLLKNKDDQPMEVDTEEEQNEDDDDPTKNNMQLSCVFNDCIDLTNDDTASKPKCDICSLAFDDLKSLAKHLADSHESTINPVERRFEFGELQIRIHQCTQCDKIFPNRVGLRRHSLSHAEPVAVPWEPPSLQLQCPLCPKILPTAIGLKRHTMNMHKTTSQREINAAVIPLPNSEPAQAKVTQTSDVEKSSVEQSVEETENLTPSVDQNPVKKSANKTKSLKSNVNQTTTKRSAKEIEYSKSKVDETVTKQSARESKRLKSNVDQTMTEQSVKEAECPKSSDIQTLVKQSVEVTECLKSKVDQTSVKQSVNESKRSKTNVDRTTIEQSVQKAECSTTNVNEIMNEQSDIETEGSESNFDQAQTEQSVNERECSKTNVDQMAKQPVKEPECPTSNVVQNVAEQSINKTDCSKSNVEQTVTELSVNKSKSSKTNVVKTVIEQSVKKTERPKSSVDQIMAKKSKVDQTVTKQAINELKRSETNVDQIVTEQSAKKTEVLKSNVDEIMVKKSVNRAECSKSNVEQTATELSVNESKSSKTNVDKTIIEQSVKKSERPKSNVDQIMSKKSVNKTECTKSKVDQTVTKQAINEPKSSKTNADKTVIEQSVKKIERLKSNVDEIMAKKSVNTPECSKSKVDQPMTKRSINEPKRSETNVHQTVIEQSVKKPESSKPNVDQIVAKKSAIKTECSKSQVNKPVIKQGLNDAKYSKSKDSQTVAKQSVNETECSKSKIGHTMAKQPVDKTKRSTVSKLPINESKLSKPNVVQTTAELSINKTQSSNPNVNQPLAKRPKINEPELLTNGIDKSTTDTNAPSSKIVEQKSAPSLDDSIAQKDLPAKVTTTMSTDIQHDRSTDDDADTPAPAVPSEAAKTDALLNCKICARQFAHVKAFNKHQQWHKFNDRAVDVEEASTVNNDSKPHPSSNGPLINGMDNLEVLAYVKCDICQQKFTKADTLKKHAFDMHTVTITSPILYQCNYCHKPFPRGKSLFLHLQSHGPKNVSVILINSSSSEEVMPFECASCERCFRFKDDLLEHVKTHLPDSESTPPPLDEPSVNGSTEEVPRKVNGDQLNTSDHSENYELKIHSDDDQENDTLKEADQTNEPEPQPGPTARKFQCPRCNRKFLRQNNLTFHLRSHDIPKHEHDKQSEPTSQPKMRRRSVRLTDDVQMSIISPPKQHQCPLCSESFRSKIILEMHVQKHSTAHVTKSTAKSSRKSLKRTNDDDDFTPEDGPKSSKRVSKEVS